MDIPESRPLHDEGRSDQTVNGLSLSHRILRVRRSALAAVLASLVGAESWSISDFEDELILVGPPFGTAIDTLGDGDVERRLGSLAPDDRP